MDNGEDRDYWKRVALGIPHPKEHTVGPEALLTIDQVVKQAMQFLEAEANKK